jgi:nitrogen fixation protein NifB
MDFDNHPCFSSNARHRFARIHLPVAGGCNIQCRYCNRAYDCINESRPGVASRVISADEAGEYFAAVSAAVPAVKVAGIAGPGDPLANPSETLKTLKILREKHPELMLCIATNGLKLATFARSLKDYGVSHVTVTVNAVDPAVGALIYQWVRYEKKVYRGRQAAELLLERQLKGIEEAKSLGILIKINTVVISGVNEEHAADVARRTALAGADIQNCISMYHVRDTAFEDKPVVDERKMEYIRREAGRYLKQMSHCARCRADAAGIPGQDNTELVNRILLKNRENREQKPYVAVASMDGLFVNQHLGESAALWIYGLKNNKPVLVQRRHTPPVSGGNSRWKALCGLLQDCCALLVSGIGQNPLRVLEAARVRVIPMEGPAWPVVEALLCGEEPPEYLLKIGGTCGMPFGCGGTGTGCG